MHLEAPFGRRLELEGEAALRRAQREALAHSGHDARRVVRDRVHGQRLEVRHRKEMQIVDHGAEPQGLLAQRRERRRTERSQTILERIELTAQYGERRTQFVQDLGDPAAPRQLEPLKSRRHPVEIAHEIADLVAALLSEPDAELPARDAHRPPAPRRPPPPRPAH